MLKLAELCRTFFTVVLRKQKRGIGRQRREVLGFSALGIPFLDEFDAAGRFVLVPPEEFGGAQDSGGRIGKILTLKKRSKIFTIQMEGGKMLCMSYVGTASHLFPLYPDICWSHAFC